MKKVLSLVGVSALLLSACGEETQEPTESNTTGNTEEVSESTETSESSSEETSEENGVQEVNEQITDDENFTIDLISIEHVIDETFDEEKYVIDFDITNKTDLDYEAQARQVSINDRMVDESLLMMSQEIAAGKSATASLEIQDYEGGELPPLENNFEMTLYLFEWDTIEQEYEYPVSVDLSN